MDQKVEIGSPEAHQNVLPNKRDSMRWVHELTTTGALLTITIAGGVLGAAIAEILRGIPPEAVLQSITQPKIAFGDIRTFNQIMGFSIGATVGVATSALILNKPN